MFSLVNFSSIFHGGTADPICLYVRTPMDGGQMGVVAPEGTQNSLTGNFFVTNKHEKVSVIKFG